MESTAISIESTFKAISIESVFKAISIESAFKAISIESAFKAISIDRDAMRVGVHVIPNSDAFIGHPANSDARSLANWQHWRGRRT